MGELNVAERQAGVASAMAEDHQPGSVQRVAGKLLSGQHTVIVLEYVWFSTHRELVQKSMEPANSTTQVQPPHSGLRACVRAWIAALVVLLVPTMAAAEAAAQPPRIGLVIGNTIYLNPKDALPGARRDANTVKDALEKVKFRVTLVQNANKQQLEAAVKAFQRALEEAGPMAVGLLYYAGHGAADRKRIDNYLVPVDVDNVTTADTAAGGVGVRWISEELRKLDEHPAIVIVIDACRSTAPDGTEQVGAATPAIGGSTGRETLEPDEPDRGYLVAFSTSKGRPASDSGQYAQALADKLTTDGLTIDQVFEEVRQVVATTTTKQLPMSRSAIVEKVCLVSCAADATRELVERVEKAVSARNATDELFRQEVNTTRAENQDLRRRLQTERTNAITEILRRAGQREGSAEANLARASLERGEVEGAEAMLRAIESESAVKQDFREAARIARQIGGLASTHSVRLAVAAFRRAAGYEPQNPENWRLVGGLWRRGTELEDSQRAYEQLVALLSENARRAPNDAYLQRELADGYSKLGSVLSQNGNHAGAQAAFQSGVTILNGLVAAPQVNSALLDELATLYGQLGDALQLTGEIQQARDSYTRGLGVYALFGQTEKSSLSAGMTIGDLERNLGGTYLKEGNRALALEHFRLALAIQERLAEERPTDRSVLRGVARAQRAVGFGLVWMRDFAGASAAFKRALSTTQRLVAADTKDTLLRYDLAHIHYGFGEASMGQGDHLLAVRSFNNALSIIAGLVVLNPKRIPWQQEKLLANTRLGDATAAYGAHEQAVATYRNSLVIHDELARLLKSTGSKYERRNQASSLDQVGDALSRLKDYSGALAAFRNSLAIREDLFRSIPSDGDTEEDISISCWNIAAMKGYANVDNAEAESKHKRGKMILQKLREEGRPPRHGDLEQRFDAALQKAVPR